MDIRIETEIEAPARAVWEVLAHEFTEMAFWTKTLSVSRPLTASELPAGLSPAPNAPFPARETTSAFAKAVEVIVEYSEEDMRLRFDTANLPFVLKSASNTQHVVPLGENKSKVMWDLAIEMRGVFKVAEPLMRKRFQRSFGGIQQELKHYAETGRVKSS